jgi:hypothetical protein
MVGGLPVSPGGGNQRTATIWQHDKYVQSTTTLNGIHDLQ